MIVACPLCLAPARAADREVSALPPRGYWLCVCPACGGIYRSASGERRTLTRAEVAAMRADPRAAELRAEHDAAVARLVG